MPPVFKQFPLFLHRRLGIDQKDARHLSVRETQTAARLNCRPCGEDNSSATKKHNGHTWGSCVLPTRPLRRVSNIWRKQHLGTV